MSKNYVGDIGVNIDVDCGTDISTATGQVLKVKKPGGAEVEWTASIYNTNYLRHTTVDGDFDEEGEYKLQSYLTLSGWTGLGETASFTIYNKFE